MGGADVRKERVEAFGGGGHGRDSDAGRGRGFLDTSSLAGGECTALTLDNRLDVRI